MNAPSTENTALQRYQNTCSDCQHTIKSLGQKWALLSYARGIVFLLALILIVCGLVSLLETSRIWFWLAGFCGVLFFALAIIHANIETALDWARVKLRSARRSVARCQRNWQDLPPSQVEAPRDFLAVSNDLDLFGSESLYQLIGTVYTPVGIDRLRDWFARGGSAEEIMQRQRSVAELAPKIKWREQFASDCEYLGRSPSGPAGFVAWSEGPQWLAKRPWLLWFARLISATTLLTIIGLIGGLVPKEVAGPILMGVIAICFVISFCFAGSIHSVFNAISSNKSEVDVYRKLFSRIKNLKCTARQLTELQHEMTNDETGSLTRLNSLGRIVWLANLRRNGVLFFVYVALQFFFCWDIHVLHLLEKWQKKNGRFVRNWFDALATWECLTALAKLSSDQPEWQFPTVAEVDRESANVAFKSLGHPLIPDPDRVCNDVSIGPPGTLLLVTGSNMSGKSTLLRSIGVNMVLAQMGSVVCAAEMKFSPVRIETSMRIHDDLAGGLSFFMAELSRLKEVVDIARAAGENRPMIFLLDEILQGTNSRERHIAVTQVVRSLIKSRAIGAISTHDLELADVTSLGGVCHTVHFREQFSSRNGKETMEFDYRMREGVSPTTNALKLLKLVGLELDEDPP